MKKEIKGSVYLIAFALVSAFIFNHFSPSGIALFGQWGKSKNTDSSIEINNPEIVKQIIKDKKRIVIDVRARETYDQGHLPTSLNYPLIEFDEIVPKILGSLKRSDSILVYCSSIECTDSHTFAKRLIALQYSDVKVFSGGFRQWQEEGYKIIEKKE